MTNNLNIFFVEEVLAGKSLTKTTTTKTIKTNPSKKTKTTIKK